MKMTAAVLEQCRQPLQLIELEIPKLKRGQVLVKIAYSAICRSQLMEINGLRGHDRWLPHLLGHEASGVVVDVGAEVTKVKPDDEVILTWIKSSGIESATPLFTYSGRTINAGPVTTFSNYAVVSENRVVLKASCLDLEAAVLFGCALATGAGMALHEINALDSDPILVLGLGGVGMAALLALVANGSRRILAIDKDPAKCALAKSFGVRAEKFSTRDEMLSAVKRFSRDGVKYCIEAGGSTETIELGFAALNPQSGTLLFASHPPKGDTISLDPHQLISGKQIKGSWGGGISPDVDIPVLAELFTGPKTPLETLTKNKFPLAKINEAVTQFSEGKVFRSILVMEHP
jgi:S-(hydroxymethyl)glutathione dehydrogenase/alcohol dehydrogenase